MVAGPGGPEPQAAEGPLSQAEKDALAEAGRRRAKIMKAAKIAAFNGWTLVVFGVLSFLISLFSPAGLVIGLILLLLGWNELRGRDLLRRLDPEGAKVLAWNQLALMGVIAAYCLWRLHRTLSHPDPELAQLEDLVGISQDLVNQVTVLAYVGVLVLTGLFQGLLARYYFARGPIVAEYLEQTPGWIVDIQRGLTSS